MANNNYDSIYVRRGTEEEWLLKDPILGPGEEAYVTDLLKSKHGDGIKKFSELEYDNPLEDGSYSTDIPLPQAIGGFKAGDKPNYSYHDMWDILLHPYVKPTVSISASPTGGTREYTNDIATVTLTATVTQKSRDVEKVEFMLSGVSSPIGTVSTSSSSSTDPTTGYKTLTYKFTYNTEIASLTSNGSTSSRTITAKVYDTDYETEGIVTSGGITYTFVSPMYVGSVDGSTNTMTDALVRGMTKKTQGKGNIANTYTVSSSKFAFAYPKVYGSLVSILDTNGFEILPDFDIQEVNVTQYDGSTTVPYYVYLFRNTVSLDSFKVTYKFTA